MSGMAQKSPEQLLLDWPIKEAFAQEDFLLSFSNEEAAKWIDKWPNWGSGDKVFHCLIIYGPAGCGKTHLCHVWQKISGAKTITLKDLNMSEFITGDNFTFIVEDIKEELANPKYQEKLLHLYNWTKEQGGYLLLTAKKHPKKWNVELADLSSRLLASGTVKIKHPDDQLLQAVIIKQFSDRQIALPQETLNYIMKHADRSFSYIRKLIQDADQISFSEKKKITIPVVKRVINRINEELAAKE